MTGMTVDNRATACEPALAATRATGRSADTATSSRPLWNDRKMPRTNYRLLGGRSVLSYDPSKGTKYTPNPRFPADVATKLITAAQSSDINVTAILTILVEKMPVDEHGRPVWADEYVPQEGLPIDSA